jgi:hypothetical protein
MPQAGWSEARSAKAIEEDDWRATILGAAFAPPSMAGRSKPRFARLLTRQI